MLRFALALLLTLLARAQTPQQMEITLERKMGTTAQIVDPGHVFERNDLIRFRFQPNFNGYLYVMNRGTGGSFTLLFPRADIGTANLIESNKEYLLPAAGSGWFGIAGPAGHDVVYWLVSPTKLDDRAAPALPPAGDATQPMTPRCNDAIFRARGECVDSTAGPKPVAPGEPLPTNLATIPTTPRDLFFMQRDKSVLVGSPTALAGPVIYEFHVAHK